MSLRHRPLAECPCSEFMCLPEVSPHHYHDVVDGEPSRGDSGADPLSPFTFEARVKAAQRQNAQRQEIAVAILRDLLQTIPGPFAGRETDLAERAVALTDALLARLELTSRPPSPPPGVP